MLANALANRVMDQMTDSATADIARAEGLVGQALVASPRRALVHYAKGNVLRAQYRCEEAIPEFETVLAINRNAANALHALGWCKLITGSIEEVIPLEEQVIRLSPRDPGIAYWYARIGIVHLLQSQTDEAIVWLEKARSANPEVQFFHAFLASPYGLKGETERAAAELAEARRLTGEGSYASIVRMQATGHSGVPKMAPCSKPLISSACVRPECRRNERRRPPCGACGSEIGSRGQTGRRTLVKSCGV